MVCEMLLREIFVKLNIYPRGIISPQPVGLERRYGLDLLRPYESDS